MKTLHYALPCLMVFGGGELMGQAGVLDPTFGDEGTKLWRGC